MLITEASQNRERERDRMKTIRRKEKQGTRKENDITVYFREPRVPFSSRSGNVAGRTPRSVSVGLPDPDSLRGEGEGRRKRGKGKGRRRERGGK